MDYWQRRAERAEKLLRILLPLWDYDTEEDEEKALKKAIEDDKTTGA